MIRMETIRDFSCESDEGKLLLAALSILTSLRKEDVREGMWGGMVHPDDAFRRVVDLANRVHHEEEWKAEEVMRKRNKKISDIIDEKSN